MSVNVNNFNFDFVERAKNIHEDGMTDLENEIKQIINDTKNKKNETLLITKKVSENISSVSASLLNDYHDELIKYLTENKDVI